MKVVQFVSVLPIKNVPHVVVHEVAKKDIPEDFTLEPYASERIYVEHEGKCVACRIKIVEKEDKEVFVFSDPESDKEDFEALVEGLVANGQITRETLNEVRDDLRPIAEAELDKQGK